MLALYELSTNRDIRERKVMLTIRQAVQVKRKRVWLYCYFQ